MHVPRKYPRIAVHFPISFTGDRDGEGVVSNLSLGGCHVKSGTTVDRKDYLTVRLHHSPHERPIEIDVAVVRWSRGVDFGLEFISLLPEEQERLERFLKHLGCG